MKNRVVVVTDLGNFRAFRLDNDPLNSSPRLESIEQFDTISGHMKLADQTTDQPGRFPKGSGTAGTVQGDMSAGERHNIELEQRKRLVKQLAEAINKILLADGVDGCFFAASKEINHMILDALAPNARGKIEKNLHLNLSKSDKNDILRHFLETA